MRNMYCYWKIFPFIFFLFLYSCQKEEYIESPPPEEPDVALSVSEARDYFETCIGQSVQTRANEEKKIRGMTPGDFIPSWDKVTYSDNIHAGGVSVPISTQYRYRVSSCNFIGGQSVIHSVEAFQQLLVLKNKNSERMGMYIVTLIPDYDYSVTNKKNLSSKFVPLEENSDFSGIVLYNRINGEIPVEIAVYEKGNKVDGVSLLDDISNFALRFDKMKSLLDGFSFQRFTQVSTRMAGEDEKEEEREDNENPNMNGGDYEYKGTFTLWGLTSWGEEIYIYQPEGGFPVPVIKDGDGYSVWTPEVEVRPDGSEDEYTGEKIPTFIPGDEREEDKWTQKPTPPDWDQTGYPPPGLPWGSNTSIGGGGGSYTPSEPKPCFTYDLSNPLINMELAPPNPQNIEGATFGLVRNGGTKSHAGVDLAGDEGTPIYAVRGGTISKIVTEQVNCVGGGLSKWI